MLNPDLRLCQEINTGDSNGEYNKRRKWQLFSNVVYSATCRTGWTCITVLYSGAATKTEWGLSYSAESGWHDIICRSRVPGICHVVQRFVIGSLWSQTCNICIPFCRRCFDVTVRAGTIMAGFSYLPGTAGYCGQRCYCSNYGIYQWRGLSGYGRDHHQLFYLWQFSGKYVREGYCDPDDGAFFCWSYIFSFWLCPDYYCSCGEIPVTGIEKF